MKHAFTLLEIVICMAILSLIGTAVGLQIHSMITSHRLSSGADRLCIALQEAQLLAITHQTDFTVHLFKERGEYWYQVQTFEPIKAVDQQPKPLPGVTSLTDQGTKKEEIQLAIYATGRIEPSHVIGLHPAATKKASAPLWIDLQTPIQIKLSSKKPSHLTPKIPALPKERNS